MILKIFVDKYFKILLFLTVFISHFHALVASKTVNPDADIVLNQLFKIKSIGEYFKLLAEFKLIDLQPIRDLTFLGDIYIYKNWGLNFTLIQNYILWILCCFVIYRITLKLLPNIDSKIRILFILVFANYPLLSSIIPWGMARKHLLSFFFILLSTNELLKRDNCSLIKISVYYTCSILSQPINLLWPVWAIFWSYFHKSKMIYKIIFFTLPILIAGSVLNFLYYQKSETFKIFYDSKMDGEIFNADKILAIGHYVFQIFIPFKLSYQYELEGLNFLLGLGLIILLIILCLKTKFDNFAYICCLLFAVLPLSIVIHQPHVLIDYYLLTPLCALLILSFIIWEGFKKNSKFVGNHSDYYFIALIVFFVTYNLIESKKWTSLVHFTTTNFHNRPSCSSAKDATRYQYEHSGKLQKELRDFLENNGCIKIFSGMTSSEVQQIIRLNSLIIYYEHEISFQDKVNSLLAMSKVSPIPLFYLGGLYANLRLGERLEHLLENMTIAQTNLLNKEPIVSSIITYCRDNNLKTCKDKIQPESHDVNRFWL
jgi:hypothetical protein